MAQQLLKRFLFLAIAVSTSVAFAAPSEPLKLKTFLTQPRLVLVIVIDQFRADYLTRFPARFMSTKGKTAPGGFRYLMESGAYFPFAEYEVLQNMTCSGHAMILTGSLPFETRIPANDFYDANLKRFVECFDDGKTKTVGITVTGEDDGGSPRRLQTSTVGDELKNAGYQSRVISIALKARSAIMLGGHRADVATWFDQKTRKWISSSYYLPDGKLPDWLTQLNAQTAADTKTKKYVWNVDTPASGLSSGKNEPVFARSFDYDDTKVLSSPYGLELTTEAGIAALKKLKLGQGSAPDILALSYSSHDFVGHVWGPNSREMEEMTIAEDKNLNRLFKAVEHEVPGGLKNALIVLTADHGMAPSVPYAKEARFDAYGIVYEGLLKKMNDALVKKYGAPPKGDWVLGVRYFNFYLNHPAMAEKKVDATEMENVLKQILLKEDGVAHAFTATDYDAHSLPPVTFMKQIMNSYVPGINGDVVAIPTPFSYFGDKPTHITGYSYDRTVPLIMAGARMKPGVFATPAKVVDLAPTLSFALGILAPATNEGRVLEEALVR